MENKIFLQDFLEAIDKAIHPKANLVSELEKILSLEKPSIYRRLRGEVAFSFYEIALVARQLGLSIDQLARRIPADEFLFLLPSINYLNPQEEDLEAMKIHISDLERIEKNSSFTELTEAFNHLPISLFCKYESLMRFYLFKWLYQYHSTQTTPQFKDIVIDKDLKEYEVKYYHILKRIVNRTHYIFDKLIFYRIVNDLKYFRSLNLFTDEEVNLIKNDLLAFLKEMEVKSITGRDPETGNETLLYISNINFDTNYNYIDAGHWQMVGIKAFVMSCAGSVQKAALDKTKKMIDGLKRHSILISVCNEIHRRSFFEKQRKLLDIL